MEIVAAYPGDAQALRDLHVAAWEIAYRDRVPDVLYRKWLGEHRMRDWSDVLRRHTADGGEVLTARYEGHIAGFCQYGPTEDDDDDPTQVGLIRRLYVAPDRQRMGIGRALVIESLDRLRQRGMSVMTVHSLEKNQPARALYESLGFKLDGKRTEYPISDEDVDPAADIRYRLPL